MNGKEKQINYYIDYLLYMFWELMHNGISENKRICQNCRKL